MPVQMADRTERELAWRRILTDASLRKVLVELAKEYRLVILSESEYERGRAEGFRQRSQAIVDQAFAIDSELGILLATDIFRNTKGELWLTKAPAKRARAKTSNPTA